MNKSHALRVAAASSVLLISSLVANLAHAQMYSWKDPNTGASRMSNIPPPWYTTGEDVRGPRVIVIVGSRTVDDTVLPYEERLALSGMSRDAIEKLKAQQRLAAPRAPRDVAQDSRQKPDADAARARSKDAAPTAAQSASPRGS